MGRPRRPPDEWKQRFEAHLRPRDLEILEWLRAQEGGTRNNAMTRALDLYCAKVEALGKALNIDTDSVDSI